MLLFWQDNFLSFYFFALFFFFFLKVKQVNRYSNVYGFAKDSNFWELLITFTVEEKKGYSEFFTYVQSMNIRRGFWHGQYGLPPRVAPFKWLHVA